MIRKSPILVVGADAEIRDELVQQLNLQGDLRARGADSCDDAIAVLGDEWLGLILLDCAAGSIARTDCRSLRAAFDTTPVIALVPADAESPDEADDTIVKPFRFSALLSGIRLHLKARENSEDGAIAIGPFVFRPAVKALQRGEDKSVRLTEKEASILTYLLRAGDKPVARDELLREVWGYNSGVTTHTLETHIYRLRQKIEPDTDSPRILVTETGGYRLQP